MVGKAQRILQARQLIRMLITCLEDGDPGPLTDVSGCKWEMPETLSAYSVSAYLDCNQCLYIISCLSGISVTSQETHLGLYLVALDWTIIVKDFSRFGRDYIDVGYYLEMVFPLYGVRFISINDNFDTEELHGSTGGLQVVFQYFKAEFYSRDLSVKYKSAKHIKFRRGEYQSKICPYGYRKGADGRMEPDEETAINVRLIFELAREGCGPKEITRRLFELGIPTPGEYKAAHGAAWHDVSRCGGIWSESSVAHILDDERYTGTYIMGKREVRDVGSGRVRMKDESEWVKIPDHHPAIISKELFEQAQASRPRRPCAPRQEHTYILKGKVFCGCCLHAMPAASGNRRTFACRHSSVDKTAPCHGLKIAEAELERLLYEMMAAWARNAPNDAKSLEALTPAASGLETEIEVCQEQRRHLYEQLVLEEISVEEYKTQRAPLDETLEGLLQTRSVVESQSARKKTAKDRRSLAEKILDAGHLTAELADILLDRVDVFPDGRVEPTWKVEGFAHSN